MNYKNITMVGYPDHVSTEAFENAQELIGVKLPGLLYELIKDYDEGHPKDDEINLIMPGGRYDVNALGAFLSFNPRNSSYIVDAYL